MAKLAHFKNFAKLKETSIEFNDITVLAGKPGTGKSYVMKFVYAIDEMFYQRLNNRLIDISNELRTLFFDIDNNYSNGLVDGSLYDLLDDEKYEELYALVNNNELLHKEYMLQHLKNIITRVNLPIEQKIEFYINNLIKSIYASHSQISNSYEVSFRNIDFKYIDGEFNISSIEQITGININEIVFVETPLILEFKKFIDKRKGKTPYHIESLLNVLDTDYSFTDEEQDNFIRGFREKSKAIIGGDIESSGDTFVFNREGDKNYDILNASSGIKSIGLLQYLVTNKALKKGSVLFWEEPEVHLHPSWQLKMVDLFVELMNAGVKIVFSTHSPYMADYLNAISKKESYRDRISFNVLDEKDGVVTNHILDDDNWNILQSELMDTFEDILWQYL